MNRVNWTNQKSQDKERETWIQVHVNFLCPNVRLDTNYFFEDETITTTLFIDSWKTR